MNIKPDKPLQVGDWQYLPEQDKLVQFDAAGKIAVTAELDNLSQKVANYFIANAGKLITKDELLQDVWGIRDVSDGRVTRVIRVLRVALGDDTREPTYIETIPKRGYRFIAPVTEIVQAEEGEQSEPAGQVAARATRQRQWPMAAALTLLLAVFIGASAWWLSPDESITAENMPIPMLRYKPLTSLDGLEFYHGVSPDERYLVYSYAKPGNESVAVLMLEDLSKNKRVQLTTEDFSSFGATFSPDGKFIAYQKLKASETCEIRKIHFDSNDLSIFSETFLASCGVSSVSSRLDWSPDGRSIVYAEIRDGEKQMTLSLLSTATGTTEKLTVPPASSFGDYSARFSNKGDKLVFLREAAGNAQIWTLDLESRASKLLMKMSDTSPGNVDWDLSDKFVLYPSTSNSLSKVDLDGSSTIVAYTDENTNELLLTKSGKVIAAVGNYSRINLRKVANKLENPVPHDEPVFNSNRNETLIEVNPQPNGPFAVVSRRSGLPQIWLIYHDGSQRQLSDFKDRERIRGLMFSPDGKRLLVHLNQNIRIYNEDGSYSEVLGVNGSVLGTPSWSKDGLAIYFAEVTQGAWQIVKASADNHEKRELVAAEREFYFESYGGDFVFWRDSNSKKLFIQEEGQNPREVDFELPVNQVVTRFQLTADGIYFVRLIGDLTYGLFYYDVKTRQIKPVIEELSVGRFSVTPDEKFIFILQNELADIDIGILPTPINFYN
ncbi:winged helix-turn-helix domain-containing protein [Rheinheimera sp. FR7-31]|uniref:winged helix-turn-helix domain-containing protein n=1 Tax=Rheinheimera fenheensis TaxID=3152295 RepID=UPI00325CF7A4